MILVSACLLGIHCRYNGKHNLNIKVRNIANRDGMIPVCPEQLGGLPTPRLPCEIIVVGGARRVIQSDGVDVTEAFRKGAEETMKIASIYHVRQAILKSNSPSCGSCKIYDGTFSGTLIKGEGLTAEMLKQNGIQVLNEDDC
jgi:uncharacterized protein YbbK (DUF523 family)